MPYASVYPLVTARAVARAFTYEVPDDVAVGAILRVPFGRSRARSSECGMLGLSTRYRPVSEQCSFICFT